MSKIDKYNFVTACPNTSSLSNYTLLIRQQPIQARISTNNERDRKPIEPASIVQIKLNNATPQETDNFHQNSYLFMCANLVHPTNDNEVYTPTHNALSGQTVSSMYKFKDIDDTTGAFFIFGNLSVKVEGCFRLKLSLFEITSTGSVCLESTFSSPFTVYPLKRFPGTLDSTFLSRSFSDQGARIRIKKENRSMITCNLKRKLDIEETPTDITTPSPLSSSLSLPHMGGVDNNSYSTYYRQRRYSITSSSTESCNTSEGSHSPTMTPHTSSSLYNDCYFSPTFIDRNEKAGYGTTITLPPIRDHSYKKPKTIISSVEYDDLLAHTNFGTPTKKFLFI